MCNLYRMENAPDAIAGLVRELGRQQSFPEGVPNFEPREVRITDRAPILRPATAAGGNALVERRWSWAAPGAGSGGHPVFNFRAEGRRFAQAERCVALGSTSSRRRRRRQAIAGIVRRDAAVGEAFTLLTCPRGADVAPCHSRKIVLLSPANTLRWLEGSSPKSRSHRWPAER